jgi:peptidyl-prolyl cis-trans isomerase C
MLLRFPTAMALGLLAMTGTAFAQAEDPVVATVDGTEIHRSEVEAAARSLPEQYRQMPLEMLYGVLLDRVIDFRLLANQAEELDLQADEEVQVALARARADVLRDALIQQKIEDGTTEAALQERYEQLKETEDFAREEVHARHILLETEEEARAVIEQLEGGAEFATVAQEKSIGPSAATGGDLGYFTRQQMVPEFAEAAFAMEAGETSSEPVQTQFGWHVIAVLDKRTTEPSFEESEPQLRQDVAREIVNELVAELRADAEIERFNLDGTPMPAPAEGEGQGEGQPPAPGAGQPPAQGESEGQGQQ